MYDFWNQVILDNPLKKYLLVFSAIIVILFMKRIFSRIIASLLFRLVKRMATGIDKAAFVNLVIGPLDTFLLILVTIASFEKLHFPGQLDFDIYEITSKQIIHALATIVMICAFIWLLLRLIDFIAMLIKARAQTAGEIKDHQLIVFFRDFLKVIIGIIGVLLVLSFAFNFDVTKFWTGLGIAGAALALSTKESIENLIASFIIFFDKPFTTGDVVKVNGITGNIEKIGLRSTRIRTEQKTYVTVPNKQMVDSIVDNLTLRTQRKGELRLEIGLGTPSDQLDTFIDGINNILKKTAIENRSVFLNDITGRAYLVNVDFFTAPVALDDFNRLKQEVNLEILRLMEKLTIEIAGASTDLRIASMP
jgi:MscS family membrane protein